MRIFGIFAISQPISMEFIRGAPNRQESIWKNNWYHQTGSNAIMATSGFANVRMTPLFPPFSYLRISGYEYALLVIQMHCSSVYAVARRSK